MTTRTVAHDVTLVSGSTSDPLATLSPLDYSWNLDEGHAPYATAALTMVAPALSLYANLAPSQGNAVLIATSVDTLGDAGAYVMLKVQSLDRNDDGTITLGLVGGEQRLIDYSPPAVDRTAWGLQSSVRSIIEYVLTEALGGSSAWTMPTLGGATGVDPGVLAFPTYRAVTNLCTNSGFEYGLDGWVASFADMARDSAQKHSGGYSMRITPTTTNATSRAALVQNLQPNTTYTMSAWMRTNGVMTGSGASDGRLIYVTGAIAGTVSRLAQTPAARNVANTWNRVSVTFTTPALLDSGSFELRVLNGTSTANPVTLWVDDILIVEGDGLETTGDTVAYFDGDTTDGTAGYNYDWQGAAGNSSSTRTPLIDRDPDVLTWSPGQSAWSFLTPILQATGTRLFSLGYVAGVGAPVGEFAWVTNRYAGSSTAMRFVQGSSLYELTQREARDETFPDGTPMFADAVVITYTWRDSLGQDHTAYDAYPTAGYSKPWNLELNEPYPGAGRARGLFLRLRARATVLTVSGPFTPHLQAGAQIVITDDRLGGSAITYADAVTHRPMDGVTEVRTKETISYPNNAWLTKTTPWSDLTGTWAAQ